VADPTVLVVEHEAGAPAGRLGDELVAAGCRLDVRRPYAGDPLPDVDQHGQLDGVHAVVVLGGSMAAWDDVAAPWLPGTRALVRAVEATGIPTLGICLGHQLAATALGGGAAPNPRGATVAVLPVCWSDEAAQDPLFAAVLATTVGVHWNHDVVATLPPGARALAHSPDGAVQAARLGRHVWGVQFHPEAGPAIVGRWAEKDGQPYVDAGFDLTGYLDDVLDREPELADACRSLTRSFLALVGDR
jgi:GMP synthase (glutamine-hydrolysing)